MINNTEEYDDPILYDLENDQYKGELPFLIKYASETTGTIMDIACGTGRVTIPLAQAGYKVTGVDIHKGMLLEAKKKSSTLGLHIDWLEQDCTNLKLNLKSELIYCVGNSFQHFLTNDDQDDFLTSVHKHLEIGGTFIFGTRFPSAEELLQPTTEEFWKSYIDRDRQCKVDVYTISSYDSLSQIQHYITIRNYVDNHGSIFDEKRTNIKLRYTYPKEMERLLKENGFEIENIFSDWNETPITSDSYQMVYVCRKAK